MKIKSESNENWEVWMHKKLNMTSFEAKVRIWKTVKKIRTFLHHKFRNMTSFFFRGIFLWETENKNVLIDFPRFFTISNEDSEDSELKNKTEKGRKMIF